ncbi:SMC family ATPase [Microbispora bryophytorum]|uniref:SMC family ATPase n=1 Tax=Microbispora bryophytorum TaxID=1460882 RepID=UPI0033F465EB
MRPLRLHMDNFGSFREPVTVDFSDVDYFALVGPTGAGKSTVIDAICFALYGTVPRWNDERAIGSALAPSALVGKVALVFETGGRRHGVVRALRRDAKGKVHTKEARLDELDSGVLATAELDELLAAVVRPVAEGEEVTNAVQRITGLQYKFFTQCVVLPQGKFAEFLHAPRRARQDLLVQLLDAQVYEDIRERAVQEEAAAKQAAEFARHQMSKFADADEAAERAAADRVRLLGDLAVQVRTDLGALRTRDQEVRRLHDERVVLEQRLAALTALMMPTYVPTLADAIREATGKIEELTAQETEAEDEERRAEEALAEQDDLARLTAELAALDTYEQSLAELETAEATAAGAEAGLEPLAAIRDRAEAALTEAEHERDRLRDIHAGAELARRLIVGEPCPTCLRPVVELPRHAASADLANAERTVSECGREAEQARRRHQQAEIRAAHLAERASELREVVSGLERPVVDRSDIQNRLATVRTAELRLDQARKEARDIRIRLSQARRRFDELRGKGEQGERDLEAARDTVVALGAPRLDRGDLHKAWTALLAWRDEAVAQERAASDAHERLISEAERLRDQERVALITRLSDRDVAVATDAAPDLIGEAVATAIAQANGLLERIRDNRRHTRELDEQARTKEKEAHVAHELALLLRANMFEAWLCSEALELLVAAASNTLRELSGGQYELALGDKGDIEVVDYAEAGMRRGVRTLSGGETFQAALALALALSSQVAGLVAAAARSLDSIFLDEGFGTLDPATLDTVATTLERLASDQERMVGVVTHVPALADRVPVRFEITRDAKGSHLSKAER